MGGGRVLTQWHQRGACKGETESFFSYEDEIVAQARAICENCPVREECLQMALAEPNLYGVWGGTTQAERRRLRRRRVA